MKDVWCDHAGKTSQARVASLISTFTGCLVAAAPLWGGPEANLSVLLVVMGGPGGLALYQKIAAPGERSLHKLAEEARREEKV